MIQASLDDRVALDFFYMNCEYTMRFEIGEIIKLFCKNVNYLCNHAMKYSY